MVTAPTDLDWWDRAACQGVDLEVFYPPGGGTLEPAKQICGGCAARRECLEYAMACESTLAEAQRHGVWGGLSGHERWVLRRCRDGRCKHPDHPDHGECR